MDNKTTAEDENVDWQNLFVSGLKGQQPADHLYRLQQSVLPSSVSQQLSVSEFQSLKKKLCIFLMDFGPLC
uniref:Uncharacterized protein n=1 Tax=Daphnia galeata TaxID=27404 RepID=A0A8J2RGI7_9CRUS|nr:unnamed protein product [Daphnia galeata]